MSLPETGAAWPPSQWAPALDAMRYDDAWYGGDRDRLARLYTHHPKSSQRRTLWGRRSPEHLPRRDRRLHIPLPSDIASTSADLLFADMPTITVPDTGTQDRLDELIEEGRLAETLLGAAETAAALGGIYLRVTWDRDLAARPLLTVMQPDGALPEFRYGMLRACTFWRELPGGTAQTVLRHFERHEPGYVRHALYEGTPDNVGRPVPLTAHPDTAALVDSLDTDGDGQTITTGLTDLTCAYMPNMLPNRLHRGSPIGRSDYAGGLHELFDALDETWTSWMRDIRLARSRIIVPAGFLTSHGPGKGSTFDEDAEVFSSLNIPPTDTGTGITLNQFAIRVAEHQQTAEAIVRQAAQSAGYSAQSFGLDGSGQAVTATEVDSRDQRSMVTRRKKAGYARQPLADMLHVMLQLDATLFGTRIVPERPLVEFGDGVAEDPLATATTIEMLNRAAAASTETRVRMAHPDWDADRVTAEVARIQDEQGTAAPDPVGSFPM